MALKIWLPLDGDLRNLGASNIEITNSGATVDNAGKIGKCYSFDGSNDYITITYSNFPTILAKNFSIAFWVYSDDDDTRSVYFGNYGISGGGNWFNLEKHTANEIRFWWNNGSPDKRFNSTKILSSAGWIHFTLTKNEGTIKTYLNGQLIETYTNENLSSAIPSTATIFRIGGDYRTSGDLMFKGKMNDFRIYDHCLSAAEVHEIAQGLVLHYKLDDSLQNANWLTSNTTFSITRSSGNTFADSGYNTTLISNSETLYRVECDAKGTAADMFFDVYFRNSDGSAYAVTPKTAITTVWQHYSLTINGSPSTLVIFRTRCYGGTAGDIIYIRNLRLISNFTPLAGSIEDSSGYNHNGEIISELHISNDTARYNNSTLFDGVDDCIIVPYNTVCPENIFTINLWFKKDALGSKNYETLFGGPSGFEMDTRAGGATSLSLYMASTRSGNRATGITMNEWHMITMTRDNTAEKYYVDGEFKSEIEAKSMPNGVYRIGAWASNDKQNYYGLISDFRIYCTPLLDTDIKQLYNVGMKVDNLGGVHGFEFDEKAVCTPLNKIYYPTNQGVSYAYDEATNTYTLTCGDRGSSSNQALYWPEYNTSKTNYDIEIGWGQRYIHTAEFYSSKAITVYIDYNNNAINTGELSGNDNDTKRLPASVTLPANVWTRIVFGYSNLDETENPDHLILYDYSYIYTTSHTDTFTVKIRNIHTYVINADSNHLQIAQKAISHNQFIEDSTHDYASISNKSNALHATEFIEM